jgi:hypothetical protein
MVILFFCFADNDTYLLYIIGDATSLGDEVLLARMRLDCGFFYVKHFRGFVKFFDFSLASSVVVKLTGEFTSLEEPTDDLDVVIVLTLLTGGSNFIGSEWRVKPESPTQKLRLLIVISIFWFSSTSELPLAKSEKVIELMILTPRVPTISAN